jgi:hypothetical protein
MKKSRQKELLIQLMNMDKKETSVDWLFDQLWETPKDKLAWFKILMEAKEMEREQIIRARQDGLDNGFSNGSWDSNLYYNETYK